MMSRDAVERLGACCRQRLMPVVWVLSVGAAGTCVPLFAQAPPVASAPVSIPGYLVGQVTERASGRPLPNVTIVVEGTILRARTDLDGRFRLLVPPGTYAVRALRLGAGPGRQDNVKVTARAATTVNFALGEAVVQLQAVAVSATAGTRAATEDALLAQQKNSSRVSDGISAEAISRAPGSDAGEAIVRVTGVSIVDNKFAVVRGLAERYSNTLLNGVELPSPEPSKRIVPLDLFPSSLLESIVVSKTATPDRPADFAGGSVEVNTKEFPNEPVREASLSFGYNSQATFRSLSHVRPRGVDWFGFDAGGRRDPGTPPPVGTRTDAPSPTTERFLEGMRNVWTPAPSPILPDLSASANVGGRIGGARAPLGYALSASWNRQTDATADRSLQLLLGQRGALPERGFRFTEVTPTVDLGLIANFALALGGSHKLGWKNLYTRGAEERISRGIGYDTFTGAFAERLTHQVRFITRSLFQTQLRGDHLLPFWGARAEWRATVAASARDEPENRSTLYLRSETDSTYLAPAGSGGNNVGTYWFRFLDDRLRTGQLDVSVPLARVLPGASLLKVGALTRRRDRVFRPTYGELVLQPGVGAPYRGLPPEQLFSPEVLGDVGRFAVLPLNADAYDADDDVTAAYAMVDLPIRSRVRLVGGLRHEAWSLDIYGGGRAAAQGVAGVARRDRDVLPSANVTVRLTELQNLRLAAYRTVARPDPREVTPDRYEPVAGDCQFQGDTSVRRSAITNLDARWERFARPGEVMSISAFSKRFVAPIAEELRYESSATCTVQYKNLEAARVAGAEVEVRRALTFLPGPLRRALVSANLTAVQSQATVPYTSAGARRTRTLRLQGQSDVVANLNLQWASADGRTDASLLANYFTDRVARYGIFFDSVTAGIGPTPDVFERGRLTVDLKVRRRLGRATLSLSGRNLTDNAIIFYQRASDRRLQSGFLRPGYGISMGLGYALR